MQERSIDNRAADHQSLAESADSRQLYDLAVRPSGGGGGGGGEPPCDCAGPPPPQFLLPPPPVDPAWAAEEEDVCDIVAPYQVCRGLTGDTSSGTVGSGGGPVLVVALTVSGILCMAMLIGVLLYCRCRGRSRSPLSNKGSGKRTDTSLLYDGLPVQTQVIPNNLRSNGHAPHIEMVAVKGQCAQLVPSSRAGVGTLFVYPPPPSLTDDGSEHLSNMYEEIPYYGRPAPSVSCYSDSDDDVISRPSEEELRGPVGGGGGVQRPSYLPTGEPRYVRTLPAGPASVVGGGGSGGGGGGPRQPRPRSADRRRPSPASPAAGPPPRLGLRRDASLHRKDPYYYSDILARDSAGDDAVVGDEAGSGYRAPYDERRPSSRGGGGPLYSQPDVAAGDPRSRDPGHVTPLANRIALDPFVDSYGGERGGLHRPRHKLSTFSGGAGSEQPPRGQRTPERGYPGAPGGYPAGDDSGRYRPPLQWTH